MLTCFHFESGVLGNILLWTHKKGRGIFKLEKVALVLLTALRLLIQLNVFTRKASHMGLVVLLASKLEIALIFETARQVSLDERCLTSFCSNCRFL